VYGEERDFLEQNFFYLGLVKFHDIVGKFCESSFLRMDNLISRLVSKSKSDFKRNRQGGFSGIFVGAFHCFSQNYEVSGMTSIFFTQLMMGDILTT